MTILRKIVYEIQKVLGMTIGMALVSYKIKRRGKGSFLKSEEIDPANVTSVVVDGKKIESIHDFLSRLDDSKEQVLGLVTDCRSNVEIHFKDATVKNYRLGKRHLRRKVAASEIDLTWVLNNSKLSD